MTHRTLNLILIALLVGVIVEVGHYAMEQTIAKLDVEHRLLTMQRDVMFVKRFGAPGTTKTDYVEGAANMPEYEIHWGKLRRKR